MIGPLLSWKKKKKKSLAVFYLTWAYVATGVLVPDWCLTQSWGTHLCVAQDTSLPASAARALVQVPGLSLHVKLPPRCSAHHHVHPLWLTAAWLIYSTEGGGDRKQSCVLCYQNSHCILISVTNKHSFIRLLTKHLQFSSENKDSQWLLGWGWRPLSVSERPRAEQGGVQVVFWH